MKYIFCLFSALSCLVLLTTCEKDNLPKPTQDGKNTMGAIVNGKPWVASACWGCVGGGKGIEIMYGFPDLYLAGQEKKESEEIFIRFVLSIPSPGTYTANKEYNNGRNAIQMLYYKNNVRKEYHTTASHTGTINITKVDRANQIISGTFDFTVQNVADVEDIITVSKGRFDVKYNSP